MPTPVPSTPPAVQVRPFRRTDRERLTTLADAHVQAVVPAGSLSVNAVLSRLEREPGEFIVDPWVVERATLVAEQRGRVSAAAHVLRYGVRRRGGVGLPRGRGGPLAAVLAGRPVLARRLGRRGRGRRLPGAHRVPPAHRTAPHGDRREMHLSVAPTTPTCISR